MFYFVHRTSDADTSDTALDRAREQENVKAASVKMLHACIKQRDAAVLIHC